MFFPLIPYLDRFGCLFLNVSGRPWDVSWSRPMLCVRAPWVRAGARSDTRAAGDELLDAVPNNHAVHVCVSEGHSTGRGCGTAQAKPCLSAL